MSKNGRSADGAAKAYTKKRMKWWNDVSKKKSEGKYRLGTFYHQLIKKYFRFFVPPGRRVLEIGCGEGELLHSLKPSFGVGIDFSDHMLNIASKKYPRLHFIQGDAHELMLSKPFDFIILSDLLNDLWDAQLFFEELKSVTHPGTRIVINFYNNLWRIPLSIAKFFGLGGMVLEQNWFSPNDIFNILHLTNHETVKRDVAILFPFNIPFFQNFLNRWLVHFPPFSWLAMTNLVVAKPAAETHLQKKEPSVSIVIPARNEAGNIEGILNRTPTLGSDTELIFIEGHSNDDTYETISNALSRYPEKNCSLFRQKGKGKGDAVRLGFKKARGEILMILDADMTVPPEDLERFFRAISDGKGEFINGVRLVYPMEEESMRFFNILGNKFFSLAFSWLLGQPIKDTLCGTKVLWKKDYEMIAENRQYFGDFDPFGDFDLLFGAAKLNLKIREIPIRYRSRVYGSTNIDRWRNGLMLLRMVFFAAKKIKFI